MTIRKLTGTLTAPPAQDGPTLVFSEAFSPNQSAEELTIATDFNLFLKSDGFSGNVWLEKQPMGDSEAQGQDQWFEPVEDKAKPYNWSLKPDDAICAMCLEPENNVRWRLVMDATGGGGAVHFRMSL